MGGLKQRETTMSADRSLKELFEAYDAADAEVIRTKAAYDDALRRRSDRCQDIAKVVAPKKQIVRAGKPLLIIARYNKSEDFTTYFFRGNKNEEAITVE